MNPYIYVGLILFVFSLSFILAFILMKDKKESLGFDRNMKDCEIMKKLIKYIRRHAKIFIIALVIMLLTIAADIVLPLITGKIVSIPQGINEGKREQVLLGGTVLLTSYE